MAGRVLADDGRSAEHSTVECLRKAIPGGLEGDGRPGERSKNGFVRQDPMGRWTNHSARGATGCRSQCVSLGADCGRAKVAGRLEGDVDAGDGKSLKTNSSSQLVSHWVALEVVYAI